MLNKRCALNNECAADNLILRYNVTVGVNMFSYCSHSMYHVNILHTRATGLTWSLMVAFIIYCIALYIFVVLYNYQKTEAIHSACGAVSSINAHHTRLACKIIIYFNLVCAKIILCKYFLYEKMKIIAVTQKQGKSHIHCYGNLYHWMTPPRPP